MKLTDYYRLLKFKKVFNTKVVRKRIKETVKLTNLITFAIFVIVSYICIKELVRWIRIT